MRTQGGFTLVELIMVMVIAGVLAAVGGARFFERKSFDASSFAEQTRAMLRYGQKLAIAQNRPVFVHLNNASIALCFGATAPCTPANQVASAGVNSGAAACAPAGWYCMTPPPAIAYTLAPATFTTLCYNALGQPGQGGANDSCTAAGFAGLSVAITGDTTATVVNVSQETGYVF